MNNSHFAKYYHKNLKIKLNHDRMCIISPADLTAILSDFSLVLLATF